MKWTVPLVALSLVLNAEGYSKYKHTCKDIGCGRNEVCILKEDPCTFGRSECGTYPDCVKKSQVEGSNSDPAIPSAPKPTPPKPQPAGDSVPNYHPPAPPGNVLPYGENSYNGGSPYGGSASNGRDSPYGGGASNGRDSPYGGNYGGGSSYGRDSPYGGGASNGRDSPYGGNAQYGGGYGGNNPSGSGSGGKSAVDSVLNFLNKYGNGGRGGSPSGVPGSAGSGGQGGLDSLLSSLNKYANSGGHGGSSGFPGSSGSNGAGGSGLSSILGNILGNFSKNGNVNGLFNSRPIIENPEYKGYNSNSKSSNPQSYQGSQPINNQYPYGQNTHYNSAPTHKPSYGWNVSIMIVFTFLSQYYIQGMSWCK